jgi:hypothetical protein
MSGAAFNEAAEVALASAATVNIGAAAANSVQITGTTTITGLGTAAAGIRRSLRFAGALTLTHNATSLILPGGANIATVANDTAEFLSLGSGNWVCTSYKRQDGTALAFSDVNALATTDNPPSSAYVAGSTGAGTNRKFRVGEVGGWCVLEEVVVSSAVASINFVLTSYLSDFEDFEFIIDHLQPATDGVDLIARFSSNGGATYDGAAADYEYLVLGASSSAYTSGSSTGDTGIQLNLGTTIGNAANEYYHGAACLVAPAVASQRTELIIRDGRYYGVTTNQLSVIGGGGRRLGAAQDTDAIQFLFRSGNIASGKIVLLGRRKVQ